MNRTKRILIALCISLVLVIVINVIYDNYSKGERQTVFVVKDTIVSGEKVTLEKLQKIEISNNEVVQNYVQTINEGIYAAQKINSRSDIN
ncbi:MAG: hypothetical protein IKV94_03690 [Clostridia bacterium]|nr:hypothetical protein [Clostridia bacterium]